MSDFRAIGAVSETLRQLLLSRMENTASVTIAPPDVEVDDPPRVNIFLYRVEESGALKNQDVPGMAPGGALGRPPLSLELHYLLTAFAGEENDREAQELLGDAMRALHEHAIVPKELLDPALGTLFEAIRVTLEPMTLEDLSKIWSALTKPYRMSTGYKVTVVQIDSRLPRHFPRLVGEPPEAGPRVSAFPFSPPTISRLLVMRPGETRERPTAYARIGDELVIAGTSFAPGAHVLLGSVDITTFSAANNRRIVVEIPNDLALQPGPIPVKVQTDVLLGDPPTPHRGFSSNLAVFVLTPHVIPSFSLGPPRRVTVTGTRVFQEGRPCITMLGDTLIDSAAYVSPTASQFAFDVPAGVTPGAYPLRVRVNGAENIEAASVVIS